MGGEESYCLSTLPSVSFSETIEWILINSHTKNNENVNVHSKHLMDNDWKLNSFDLSSARRFVMRQDRTQTHRSGQTMNVFGWNHFARSIAPSHLLKCNTNPIDEWRLHRKIISDNCQLPCKSFKIVSCCTSAFRRKIAFFQMKSDSLKFPKSLNEWTRNQSTESKCARNWNFCKEKAGRLDVSNESETIYNLQISIHSSLSLSALQNLCSSHWSGP